MATHAHCGVVGRVVSAAAKHIPKKKKKKVVPAPSSESDSSKLPSDTVQDVKALATELAAGSKYGDEEKAIGAESAHASALEVCTVEPVKCSSTARLNRLNDGFTISSLFAEPGSSPTTTTGG